MPFAICIYPEQDDTQGNKHHNDAFLCMTPYKTCKYGAILPRQDLLHSLQRARASRAQKNAGFSWPKKAQASRAQKKRGLLGPKKARASRAPKTRASRALIARKASLGPKKRGLLVPMRRHVVNKTRALASMPNTRKLLAHNTSGLPCLTHASFSRITQAGIPLPNTTWTLLSPPSHQHRHNHGHVHGHNHHQKHDHTIMIIMMMMMMMMMMSATELQ